VNPTAIVFAPLAHSITGPRGSFAAANAAGSSNVGVAFFGCDMAVTAISAAAPGGGAANAKSDATDPWDVTFQHRPGRKSYVLASVTPDFSLEPARGTSGMRLYGSFGEIALSLNGSTNKPKASVSLAPGWRVYTDVTMPRLAGYIRRPKRLLTKQRLERLFLRQHSKKTPFWLWTVPPPTLTFVKEVPSSVASERVEIGIGVEDADASGDDRDRRRRK
jgi:hypothetical protein